MSWHCTGPGRGWPGTVGPLIRRSTIVCSESRSIAESAAVGAPLPPRFATIESSMGLRNCGGATRSSPKIVTTYPPCARAESATRAAAATSCGVSPCVGGAFSPPRISGLLTTCADSGCARGTRMTSMRNSSLLGSWSGDSPEQPASSLGERTGAVPDT